MAEIDQKTAPIAAERTRPDSADPEDGDAYGPAGTEYDHDDQDPGDVLGLTTTSQSFRRDGEPMRAALSRPTN